MIRVAITTAAYYSAFCSTPPKDAPLAMASYPPSLA